MWTWCFMVGEVSAWNIFSWSGVAATLRRFASRSKGRSEFVTSPGAFRETGNRDCNADIIENRPFATGGGHCELFLLNLNAAGTGLVYSTYIAGGQPGASFSRVALDASGNVYLAGTTFPNRDFPVSDGALPDKKRWSGFVARFSADGTGLLEATRLPSDVGTLQLAVRGKDAYLSGWTYPADGQSPTPEPFQTSFGGGYGDAFITRVRMGNGPNDSVPPPQIAH
jgi:hypothetical protein